MAHPQQDIENLPIDIHYNKLLDWLINRRHCQQQWQPAAFSIREKVGKAVEDMPAVEAVVSIIQGSNINYFHCLKIVELLKDTDFGEKNIFGQYSSQKMKDWAEIVKLYEKDGVFLAETAQILMRNVNYEVPALKKQITKCQQIEKECERKKIEYVSKATELRKKYQSSCNQMGIKGEKIKSELAALVSDLPSVYSRIAASTKGLDKAVQYYKQFIDFVNGSHNSSDCVPVLKLVQNKGDVTTYEWKTGSAPVHIQETQVVIDTKDEEDITGNLDDIDWGDTGQAGDSGGGDTAGDEIDFDVSQITIESGGLGEAEGGIDLSVEPLVEEIDWGDAGDIIQVSESTAEEEGVARGEDALTLMDNPITRNLLLDDLMELEAFLSQRVVELSGDSSVLATSQFQTAPAAIQLDCRTVEIMATEVKDIIGQLTSVQIQHLMMIRNSPRYVDRLKDSLQQTLTLADKMEFLEKETEVKRLEALEEQRDIEPKLDKLIARTKEIQKQMESEISKKYKNRPVNIMGEINII